MKTVLITGANGFIARHLARSLGGAARRLGVSRAGEPVDGFDLVRRAALGDALPSFDDDAIDAVVHTANHEGSDEYRVNVDGTWQWFQAARDRGASVQLLLSTLSATPQAVSDYGRAKYELEQRFIKAGQVAFKLGIVVGNGGMFGRMKAAQQRLRIVPLLDNGSPRVFVLGIDYLCRAIRECVLSAGAGLRGRAWNMQQPESYTLREIMTSIRRHYRYRCHFLPVPSLPILWTLRLAETLPIRLPVSSANLRGLRQSKHDRYDSDFAHFGEDPEPLDRLVARAAASHAESHEGGVTT